MKYIQLFCLSSETYTSPSEDRWGASINEWRQRGATEKN